VAGVAPLAAVVVAELDLFLVPAWEEWCAEPPAMYRDGELRVEEPPVVVPAVVECQDGELQVERHQVGALVVELGAIERDRDWRQSGGSLGSMLRRIILLSGRGAPGVAGTGRGPASVRLPESLRGRRTLL